jgi:MFS family permease
LPPSTDEPYPPAAASADPSAPLSLELESRRGYAGWPVVSAAAAGVFFAALVVVTFPVFLKPWATEFSWSRQEISTAFAIAALVAGTCAAPLGFLLDRYGPRRVTVPSLIALGFWFASLSLLTPRLWHLYGLFALLGLAGIGTSPVAYARAVSTWFTSRRGLALALVITGGALGGMIHPTVTAALVRQMGWRAACLVLGGAVLAIGVPLAARFVRERPTSRREGALAAGATAAAGVRTRIFWVLAVVQLCATMVQNGVIVHLSALLTDRGVSSGHAAVALSGMAAAAVVGRLITGFLIDRLFATRVLIAMMALAAAGAFLLSSASSFGTALFAAVLVGFGTGGEADVVPYLLSRYFGLRSFSALYGLVWLANAIGGALGPVQMGRGFDLAGSYEPVLVRLALVVLAASGLAFALPRYGVITERP